MAMIRLSSMVGTVTRPVCTRSVLKRPFDFRAADPASMAKPVRLSTWRDTRYSPFVVRRKETGLVVVGIITSAQMIGSLAVRHTSLSRFQSLTYLIFLILPGSSFRSILLRQVRSTGYSGCWGCLDAGWCGIASGRVNGRSIYWSTSTR